VPLLLLLLPPPLLLLLQLHTDLEKAKTTMSNVEHRISFLLQECDTSAEAAKAQSTCAMNMEAGMRQVC
jgi:hypothetical protein